MVYGQPGQKGSIVCYSGGVKVDSSAQITSFHNGYSYQFPETHNYSSPIEISLQGVDKLSYVLIESPSQDNPFELRDGLPETLNISPNTTYIVRVNKHTTTKGNFII